LLGLSLVIQIATGLFLAINFSARTEIAFDRVIHIQREVELGWLIRSLHANGARMFFLFLYMHIGRGVYFGSFNNKAT